MMMIALITISSLVSLIKGLCNPIRFRCKFLVQSFTVTSFAFFFWKQKCVSKHKQLVQISSRLRLLACMYTCVLWTHGGIHMCQDLVHLDSSGPPGVLSRPLGSHRVPHMRCVCMCVRVHTRTHTYTPTCVQKNREDTNYTSISPSVENKPPLQATSALHRLDEPPHPCPPTRMNKLRIHEHTYTPCSDCVANLYADVKTPV